MGFTQSITALRRYFGGEAIAQRLTTLPPIKTTIMDLVFPTRPQHPSSVLGIDEITEAAGEIYRQLLAENPDGRDSLHLQILTNYAQYLGITKRGTQAEDLLKAYLANHPNMPPGEQSSILYALANTARMSTKGSAKRASASGDAPKVCEGRKLRTSCVSVHS